MPLFGGGKREAVKELFELEIAKDEIAVLLMDYSGLILRTPSRCLAIDVADLLGRGEIAELKCLDLLVYTHGHYDHFEVNTTLEIFEKTNCPVVAESSVYQNLKGRIPDDKLFEPKINATIEVNGMEVSSIPGVHVGPITLYVIDVDGLKVFHGGDSGYASLSGYSADVAFVPTGEPSPTASPRNAYKMVLDLKPKLVIPMHGSQSQHEALKKYLEELPEVKIEILEKYKPVKLKV